MTARLPVLVTDGEQRAALAVVRSLGRAGYPVYVAASARPSMAGASRHARAADVIADPLTSPAAFVEDVAALVRRRSIDVVIPVTDAALLALAAERRQLGGAVVPWPDVEAVRQVSDKAAVTAAGREVGLAVPRQRVVSSVDEAMAVAAELRFPLVIKPTRSVREQPGRASSKLAVAHAAGVPALRRRLAELGGAAFPALLQERIVGPGVGVSLLVRDGQPLAHFSHRRLRERPPAGGVSVYAESIATDDALLERSVALVKRFGWSGVAMVEYKIDAGTGTPYLMEVNGRFWGSLQLAIDAGVDFPVLLLDAARGLRVVAPTYRTGVRFRWWWGDVDHVLVRLLRSSDRLALWPGAPSRWQVLRQFAAAGLPHRDSDVLRTDDIGPFVVETRGWIRAATRSLLAGRGGPVATRLGAGRRPSAPASVS